QTEHAAARKLAAKLILPAVVVRRVERRVHRDVGGAAPFLSQHAAIGTAAGKAVVNVGAGGLANGACSHVGCGEIEARAQLAFKAEVKTLEIAAAVILRPGDGADCRRDLDRAGIEV